MAASISRHPWWWNDPATRDWIAGGACNCPSCKKWRALIGQVCDLCGGTGWAHYPDPFFDGALIDARCPACEDTTVRAPKSRWENNDGTKVGPK